MLCMYDADSWQVRRTVLSTFLLVGRWLQVNSLWVCIAAADWLCVRRINQLQQVCASRLTHLDLLYLCFHCFLSLSAHIGPRPACMHRCCDARTVDVQRLLLADTSAKHARLEPDQGGGITHLLSPKISLKKLMSLRVECQSASQPTHYPQHVLPELYGSEFDSQNALFGRLPASIVASNKTRDRTQLAAANHCCINSISKSSLGGMCTGTASASRFNKRVVTFLATL